MPAADLVAALLHGREGLANFRRDFLDQDVEASLRTAYTPDNLLRAYRGGVNDQQNFPVWLDQQLFHGATLGDLARPDRPRLILHATDLYNRAPFAFDRASFAAICSSYDDFPLAQAVAASAAVPIAFAPISLRNFRESCPTVVDAAPVSARADQKKLLADSHIQQSIARYGEAPDLRYLELGKAGDTWFLERIRHGAKKPDGSTMMPGFEGTFSQEAMWAIRTYLESQHTD